MVIYNVEISYFISQGTSIRNILVVAGYMEGGSAMNTLGFTIVGFGNIAKTHMIALRTMPIIKQLPVTPVLNTLVTRRPEQTLDQARQIGFVHVTSSLEEALQYDGAEAISICTPNALHAEQVRMAVQYNQAIYCEKPVTESAASTAQLLKDVPSTLTQQLAFVYRYHPAVMRIKAWLEEGIIGDVLQCRLAYLRSGYLSDARPYSWRVDNSLSGGGAITDIGVHALDLLRHWFGEMKSVDGNTETFIKSRRAGNGTDERLAVHVDDWALMNYVTEQGIQGIVEVSRIALGEDAFRVHIVGTKGSITCDLETDKKPQLHLVSGRHGATPEPESLALLPDEKATMGIFQDSHFAALHHFILRHCGDERWDNLAPTLEDGLVVERLVDQVIHASQARKQR